MFDSLIDSYKHMDEFDKKVALVNELKKLITVLQNICEEKNISFRKIDNIEKLDLDNEYLETLFTYIMYLEELITSYIEMTLE